MTQSSFSVLARGLNHPEGLAWHSQLGLYAGGESGEIYRVDPRDGTVEEVANTGGFVLGLAFGPGGRLYACDMDRRAVLSVDVTGSRAVENVTAPDTFEWVTPNHLVFAKSGVLYVSDSGSWDGEPDGRVVAVNGGVARVVASRGHFTNGLALDADERWLYAAESSASRIVRYEVGGEGLGDPEVFASLHGTVPDGLAFAEDGRLLVSCYRPDAIFLVSATGDVSTLASDWTGLQLSAPTNIAFTDAGWVTANLGARHLTSLDWSIAGAHLNFSR